MSLALDRPDEDPRDAELRKLRKINRVLMDRVERDMDVHGNNAYSLFRTAITLETEVSERTAELATLTHQLMQEISRRRQIEKALTLAKAEAEDANLGKTRFLAAATHDLYQPLNAARLFLGALADEAATARAHDLLGQVDAALDSVDELLGALLDISKLDSGAWPVTLANVAIGPMLARMAEEYLPQAQAAGLDLRAVPSSAVVHTDRLLFERGLRNLISNAIRYTAEGRLLIGCRRRPGRVAVQVWDSGIGIPEAMRQEIFREFKRLGNTPRQDAKGLGLGLAIVDRIARLLDLGIEVESIVGRGSCFTLTVASGNAADAVAEPEKPAAWAASPILGGTCIVVVDNDAAALDAMRSVADGWGCRLVAAPTADAALAQLEAACWTPDLVVADYHLDAGRTGTNTVHALRERYGAGLPSLIVSGDHSAETATLVRDAGLPFLSKSAGPARLRAMISFLVKPPQSPPS